MADRAAVRQVRRQAFGLTLPALSLFDRADPAEDAQTVTLKVESAVKQGDGKWVFHLEGGQVWRQIDTTELTRDPVVGGTVTINKASLGSYKLSTSRASTIRVHRDN